MPAVSNPNDLSTISLFRGLSPEQLSWLNGRLHRRTFPSGSYLFAAEQPGEVVYIILNGTVKIHIVQEDGTDVILAILGVGDTVGEMSLVDSAGRSANVVTLEESILLWMDRVTFQQCLERIPALTRNLVQILSGRLRMANAHIQSLATLDVYGRVARQILAFAEQYGQATADGEILIPVRLTQSDIAGLVGASRERVNRAMVFFKERKYISVDKNYYLTVHAPAALAKY